MFSEPVVFVSGEVFSHQRVGGSFIRRMGAVFVGSEGGKGRSLVESVLSTLEDVIRSRGRAHGHPRTSALPSRGFRRCRRDGLPRCSRGDPRDESDPSGRSTPSSTGRDPPCGRRVPPTHRQRLEGRPSARGPGSRGGRGTPWRGLRLLLRVGLSGPSGTHSGTLLSE
jgi:hypothetical protein